VVPAFGAPTMKKLGQISLDIALAISPALKRDEFSAWLR
jgi:hypothetical protein